MIFMTRDQMREYDRVAIEEYGVPGVVLMENAGRGATDIVEQYLRPAGPVAIVCGGGNNGGDGFVVARHLVNRGYDVRVYLVANREKLTGDAGINLSIFQAMEGEIVDCQGEDDLSAHLDELNRASAIVDALLGTGLTKEVRGPVRSAIELLNLTAAPKIAIDVPSGVSADTGSILGVALRAEATATFAHLKRGLLLFPGAEFAGAVHVVDIGAPAAAADRAGYDGILLDEARVARLLPPRTFNASREDLGHLLVLSGSVGKAGAASLCAEVAVRAGVGQVTVAASSEGRRSMESRIPEVAFEGWPPETSTKSAVAVGPSCSKSNAVADLLTGLLSDEGLPVVVDASLLVELADGFERGRRLVITADGAQLSSLAEVDLGQLKADLVGVAREQARRLGAVIVVKGARGVIAGPEGDLRINPTGNSGMASAGFDDALTGLIGSLLAQGSEPIDAASLALYLLGLAADHEAADRGERGLVCSDVIEKVSPLLLALERRV